MRAAQFRFSEHDGDQLFQLRFEVAPEDGDL